MAVNGWERARTNAKSFATRKEAQEKTDYLNEKYDGNAIVIPKAAKSKKADVVKKRVRKVVKHNRVPSKKKRNQQPEVGRVTGS